jgi:transcriptional regulator with XRE-family HTH domain
MGRDFMSERLREIAARVREMREVAGLTQLAAADRLGITEREYDRYEDAGEDIPISVLFELADLFGVDMTELLTGTSPKLSHYCYVKSGEGVQIERFKGYRFQSLAFNFINRSIEPLLVTVDPEEGRKTSLVTHPGQEFNYVLTGRIRVVIGGATVEMAPGDSLYFDPEIPHGQVALDGRQATFLTVILHESGRGQTHA